MSTLKYSAFKYMIMLTIGLVVTETAQAQYCQLNNKNAAVVNKAYLSADSHSAQIKNIIENLKSIEQQAASLKNQILILTGPKTKNTFSEKLSAQLQQQQSSVVQQATAVSPIHSLAAKNLIDAYFIVANELIEVALLENPYSTDIATLKKRFALHLSADSYNKIFAIGIAPKPGLEVSVAQTNNNHLEYDISFTSENIFRAMVRAAAHSPLIRQNQQSYFETVRCGLSKILVGKIKMNQALINRDSDALPVNDNQKLCLGAPASELIAMSQSDVDLRKEKTLRLKISSEFPQLGKNFSDSSKQLFSATELAENITTLRVFPDMLDYVNSQTPNLPQVTPAQLQQVITELNQNIDAEFAHNPELQQLRHIWAEPTMIRFFESAVVGCNYNFVDVSGKGIDLQSLVEKLTAAEDMNLMSGLSSKLLAIAPKLTQMTEAQIQETLREFIRGRAIESVSLALETVLSRFDKSNTPELDSLMAAIQNQLQPMVANIVNTRLRNSEIDKYTQKLASIANQKKNDALSLHLTLLDFATEMIAAAKKINFYMDENTASEKLPYDREALLRSFQSIFSRLAADNLSRVRVLAKETDFESEKKIWGLIKTKINNDAQKSGAQCVADGLISGWLKFGETYILNMKPHDQAQQDCINLQIFADAMGLEGQKPTSQVTEVLAQLSKHMSPKEVKSFVTIYREQLSADLFSQYRLLDATLDLSTDQKMLIFLTTHNDLENPNPFLLDFLAKHPDLKYTKQRMYEFLATHSDLKSALPVIRTQIEKSLTPLRSLFTTVINAKQEKDFDFFIKRTKVINALLGENDLAALISTTHGKNGYKNVDDISAVMESKGFVFPDLIEHHKQLQKNMLANEGINDEVENEFISANVNIGFTIIGGWAVKGALVRMPGWISGTTERIADGLNPFIDGQSMFFMKMLFWQTVNLQAEKWYEFEPELQKIDNLASSETLAPEGAENPLPMISWSEYQSQKRYYISQIDQATSSQIQNGFWLIALPATIRYIGHPGFAKFKEKRFNNLQVQFDTISYQDRIDYESKMRIKIDRQVRGLWHEFRDLGFKETPKHEDLELGSLETHLSSAQYAKSSEERMRLQKSYNKIVTQLGRGIEEYRDSNMLYDSYSKALLGESGQTSQLERIYTEYTSLLRESAQ